MPPKVQRVKRKRNNQGGDQSSLANWVVSKNNDIDVKTDNGTDRKTELPTGAQMREFDYTERRKCLVTMEGHCTTLKSKGNYRVSKKNRRCFVSNFSAS